MKTVADLIAELQKLNPSLPVLVDGYEGGYTTFSIAEKEVFYHPAPYCGEYETTVWRTNDGEKPPFQAILLERGESF